MNSLNSIKGLTNDEVDASRKLNGSNVLEMREEKVFWQLLKEIALEPMFILLLITCFIYFFAAQYREGITMGIAVFIVAGISLFQGYRSRNAITALKKMAASRAVVMRNGQLVRVATEEIVTGDILMIEEGEVIAADGTILSANDLSLNESILTGESFPVNKSAGNNVSVYKGTLVTTGSATIKVTAVGDKTMFGKIGLSLREITVLKTPLQIQIRSFVKYMAWIGAFAFIFIVAYNYYYSSNFLGSFLQGLTLAMSILPEEIPVAFSTFMALGAYRLLQNKIIVKQPQYVETLGSATVICTDKTGTLTQNKMSIAYLYDAVNKVSISYSETTSLPASLIEYAMWSSETKPFDPMEKSIHALYERSCKADRRLLFKQVHEYPVAGKPPMMTHIFKNEAGETIIAAKGAPEAILAQSNLSLPELKHIEEQAHAYAKDGYRVLGVGSASWNEKQFPLSQETFSFTFLGLLAFQDPPKENMLQTINTFHKAGIQVKMITGDYAETALAIARQVGLDGHYEVLTGEEIVRLTEDELRKKVKDVNVFARMYPEAKLKVIEVLRENGEVVAMTGDGVNDGPALKAAHIGIAMGQRGSEVAKEAASLILVDDDLSHLVEAVAQGRKIYDNLKKAIRYIVSIHIPIILIVILPLLLKWRLTGIFSPIHIIFLELIMGPTCSIIYENEPMESGAMERPPRKLSSTFLSLKQLLVSIVQGLFITAACLGIGYYYMEQQYGDTTIRSVIFVTLLFCNIFLTLVNRSFRQTIFATFKNKNRLLPIIITISFLGIISLFYFPYIRQLFGCANIGAADMLCCAGVAFTGTCWIELVKISGSKFLDK